MASWRTTRDKKIQPNQAVEFQTAVDTAEESEATWEIEA